MADNIEKTPYPKPANNLVTPLLTDLYQITMAYAYWKTNQYQRSVHFELFFRKNVSVSISFMFFLLYCAHNMVCSFYTNYHILYTL